MTVVVVAEKCAEKWAPQLLERVPVGETVCHCERDRQELRSSPRVQMGGPKVCERVSSFGRQREIKAGQ